jgi:hypothetical protein
MAPPITICVKFFKPSEFLAQEKPNCAIQVIGLVGDVTYRDFLQFFWQ